MSTKTASTPIRVQQKLIAFGSRIALARRARELSQIDLAQLADVGVSTVASLEAGHQGVSVGNLLKVLKALELLDQVDAWLLPQMDEAIIDRGIRAVMPAFPKAGRRG